LSQSPIIPTIAIKANNLGKRYGYQWIINDLNFIFDNSLVSGITGSNGSGKSTLIQLLSGYLTPSEGKVQYIIDDIEIATSQFYRHLSLVAPYTNLIQEFSLREMFEFHFRFKNKIEDFSYEEFLDLIHFKDQEDKFLGLFSSGMKQKVQLGLALLSDAPFVLLDEPTSFLDMEAKSWFEHTVAKYKKERVIIIASNDEFDLALCERFVGM